jgi:hypothetical protein
MFERLRKLWDENGFNILLILSVIFILILALFKIGKKGTWSNYYVYNPKYQTKYIQRKKLPKESKGEAECRRVLEKIFNRPFKSTRPNFLRNPVTGGNYNLELDCYNDLLKLAVEYNGVQHYKYNSYFHKNKEAFRNQCYRDELKRRMCKDNRVNLIEVPYTVPITDIENFLIKKLKYLGYI